MKKMTAIRVVFNAFGTRFETYCDNSVGSMDELTKIVEDIWGTAHIESTAMDLVTVENYLNQHIKTGKPRRL